MKKGTFRGLLYREYYLAKYSIIVNLISFAVFAVMGVLMFLSLKHGNLGLLLGDLSDGSGGIIKNKEVSEILRLFISISIKVFPPLMAGVGIIICTANTAAADTMNKWNRFEHSTPVTPMRFAAVKTVSTVIAAAVSFILAMIYMFTINIAPGEQFTYGDFSVVVVSMIIVTIWFGILPQIFITLLKNRDMGFLCALFIPMVSAFIVSAANAAKENEAPSANENADIAAEISLITDKAQEYRPLAIGVLIIAFAVLFISMYLLYKRREK